MPERFRPDDYGPADYGSGDMCPWCGTRTDYENDPGYAPFCSDGCQLAHQQDESERNEALYRDIREGKYNYA